MNEEELYEAFLAEMEGVGLDPALLFLADEFADDADFDHAINHMMHVFAETDAVMSEKLADAVIRWAPTAWRIPIRNRLKWSSLVHDRQVKCLALSNTSDEA